MSQEGHIVVQMDVLKLLRDANRSLLGGRGNALDSLHLTGEYL